MLNALSSLVAAASTGLQQIGGAGTTASSVTSPPAPASTAEDNLKSVQLPRYTLNDVCQHCRHDDCWLVIHNRVYDVTSFLTQHPGGVEILWEHAGRDATLAFMGTGHTLDAVALLHQYCIGILVEEEHMNIFNDVSMQVALTANS
uniref:Putative cytochrome b5 n=1 Tax=Ixodes ricinus TaxID=34613 RepID=V5H5V8_IXORI